MQALLSILEIVHYNNKSGPGGHGSSDNNICCDNLRSIPRKPDVMTPIRNYNTAKARWEAETAELAQCFCMIVAA